MKYAYLITFSWLLSISSEAAKMTPGQPEGCAFCPAFQHEYLSLFPCVTNKAELPPHSLVNRHRSCRAKGRRGGGAAKQTRQKQDDVPGRNTRDTPSRPADDSGGNSWSPSLREEPSDCWEKPNMSARDQVLVFGQRATPPNQTNAAVSLIPENPAALPALPALPPTTSELCGVSARWHRPV